MRKSTFWRYFCAVLLTVTFGVTQVWADDVIYDLTGYTTQITNGWTHDYGDIYVGRKGSNYTPVSGGLPTGNSNIFAAFEVTEASTIRVVFVWTKTNGDLSGKQIDLASISKDTYDKLALASTGTGNDVKYSIDNFSSSQNSAVAINRSDANKEINVDFEKTVNAGYYAVYTAGSINGSALIKKIIVIPSTPTLTGAWMLSEADVTGKSINLVQGASAPAAPTFSVGATSGTPTASDYSVTYSLKAGSTEGIFTFGETTGISTISTANAGEATIVATLTTANASNYLTPETNTFEYTVKVAAASAPAFTSVTPSETTVARGTASSIAAVVTGNPTPTIQWYSNTTASNEGGTIISGATDLTLNLENAAVGTYYYYAVATNTTAQVNNVPSAVQTITVLPKAPVLPAAAHFVDSKSVTIAKADGEAEGAVIKYSTDGENWETYSAALVLTATTTVSAKVEQDGLASAVVSATFTKVTPKTQRTVTSTETWDWSKATGSDVNLTNETTPAKDSEDDVVAANFDGAVYEWDCGFPENFDAIVLNKFQRPKNGSYYQGQTIKIKTSVPGTIEVEFSNTGSKRPNRYLSVNGTIYGEGSGDEASASHRTVSVPVPAGDIILTGIYEPNESNYSKTDKYAIYDANLAGQPQYLNYYKVIFTEAPKYAVTCDDAEHGSIAADIASTYAGETVTLTATPDTGYELATLKVLKAEDDSDVTDDVLEGNEITMPAYAVKVVATFSAIDYTITCNTAENGTVTADKAKANIGETVTLTVTPDEGYKVSAVSVNGEAIAAVEGAYSFTMPAANVTVSATFVDDQATALDNTNAAVKAVKVLRDGQLIIEKNGKTYNALGQFVR